MSTTLQYASFLIRLWREPNADPAPPAAGWHGEVEHIQSGQHWVFSTMDDLLLFLRRQAGHPEVRDMPDTRATGTEHEQSFEQL
jgi:hypothetical protein